MFRKKARIRRNVTIPNHHCRIPNGPDKTYVYLEQHCSIIMFDKSLSTQKIKIGNVASHETPLGLLYTLIGIVELINLIYFIYRKRVFQRPIKDSIFLFFLM